MADDEPKRDVAAAVGDPLTVVSLGKTAEIKGALVVPSPADNPRSSPVAALLRDSAVLLAGATALLYLTSHLYATQYLSVFGVGAGFHGVSLAHLSMVPFLNYLLLVCVGWFIYDTLTEHRSRRFVLQLIVLVFLIGVKPIVDFAH